MSQYTYKNGTITTNWQCEVPRKYLSVSFALTFPMLLLYLWTVLLAFMVLMVHLHPQLTMTELAFAAIPVGSIGGAWLFFLVSMLLNFLRSVRALSGLSLHNAAYICVLRQVFIMFFGKRNGVGCWESCSRPRA